MTEETMAEIVEGMTGEMEIGIMATEIIDKMDEDTVMMIIKETGHLHQ